MNQTEYRRLMDDPSYSDDIKSWLSTRTEDVVKGIEILKTTSLPANATFHISRSDGVKVFTPLIGTRQSKTEDRTTPRVCVAATLLDCVNGYAAVYNDFFTENIDGKRKDDYYRGGYYIYKFQSDYVVKVDKSLVYDSETSNELWLVPHSPNTVEYKAPIIGKMWVRETSVLNGRKGNVVFHWYMELTDTGCLVDNDTVLPTGYYKWSTTAELMAPNHHTMVTDSLTVIDAREYRNAKTGVLDMLGWTGW